MRVRSVFLAIYMTLVVACTPQTMATPAPMSAVTDTPAVSVSVMPQTSPTPDMTSSPFQWSEIPVQSCSQLVDASISNAGVLEILYTYGNGLFPPFVPRDFSGFVHSDNTQLWLWSETASQAPTPYPLPSDAMGPQISEDRSRIIFRRDVEATTRSEFWVMDVDGQNERMLAEVSFKDVQARNPRVRYAILEHGWVPHTKSMYYKVTLFGAGMEADPPVYDAFVLVDVSSGQAVSLVQSGTANEVVFAPDGSQAAIVTTREPSPVDAGSSDSQPAVMLSGGDLRLVNTSDGSIRFTLPTQIRDDFLEYSPDGNFLVGYSADGIFSLNIKNDTWQVIPLQYKVIVVNKVAISPEFTWAGNSTLLLSVANTTDGAPEVDHSDLLIDPDANFTVWRANLTDAAIGPVQTFRGLAGSAQFSPDGKYLTFRINSRQTQTLGFGKFAAFVTTRGKMGGAIASPDLSLAELSTGNTLVTLKDNGFFAWSGYPDLYVYDQIGRPVDEIFPLGIFLGQVGREPLFLNLETGNAPWLGPVWKVADWADSENFAMDVGCEISLVSLTRQ